MFELESVEPRVHFYSDLLLKGFAEHQIGGKAVGVRIPREGSHFYFFLQDELMAELEELEQEELDKNLLEISGPETVPLPNVPSIALPSKPGEYFFQNQDTQ
jgi:charged multivesicular body protein 4